MALKIIIPISINKLNNNERKKSKSCYCRN